MHRYSRIPLALLSAWLLIGTGAPAAAQTDPGFARLFTARTMRLDYFHTGDNGRESFSVDRIVSDGPWAGSRTQLLDTLNLGTYRFELADSATGRVLYSRGFSSMYAEWESTSDAATTTRTFHESLRFPWPLAPFRVTLSRRDPSNAFVEIWSTEVNPEGPDANRATPSLPGRVWTVFENGPPTSKVDVVLVSEGYTVPELPRFHADVRRLVARLFASEPFKSHRRDFNVRAVDLPSAVSGVNRPQVGAFRRTPLSTSYNIFGSERYLLTEDNRALRDALSGVPYEFLEIVVNEKQYGGGGIFNDQATVAAHTAFSEYIFVHEFGHHFAGLADEYYTSPVAYQTGSAAKPEPWEPNVTALEDASNLKWKDLVDSEVPIPTPWDKETYEVQGRELRARRERLIAAHAPEAAFDSLFVVQRELDTRLLGGMRYAGRVGAFEGAAYESTGLYRPQLDCIMFSRDAVGFCRVCRRAIERIIALYSQS